MERVVILFYAVLCMGTAFASELPALFGQQLLKAVRAASIREIKILVDNPLFSKTDNFRAEKNAAIQYAIVNEYMEIAEILVLKVDDVSQVIVADILVQKFFHHAYHKLVALLHKKGAYIAASKAELFFLAIKRKDSVLVKEILTNSSDAENYHSLGISTFGDKQDIDLNAEYEINFLKKMPLTHAVFTGDMDTVGVLIEHGADVETISNNRNSLMISAWAGYPDLVAFLLAKGADVNAKNKFDQTPLMFAARHAHNDLQKSMGVVGLLISNGAIADAVDANGFTALDHVRTNGKASKELISLLDAITEVSK